MPILKIGIQTLSLGSSLRRTLAAASRLGAEGVEIDLRTELPFGELTQTALRQLRKLLEDYQLSVAAAAFPLRRGFSDPEDLDRRVAAVMGGMSAAAKLGARVLIAPLGDLPDEEDEATGNLMRESLTAVAAHGDRVGARLAIATGVVGGNELASFLARFGEAGLGVNLNPARLLAAGQNPVHTVQSLGDSILHVHANDAVRDLSSGGVTEVALGRGSVDFPELLATLQQYEYRGWITIERQGSVNSEREVGDAVAYLREVQRG